MAASAEEQQGGADGQRRLRRTPCIIPKACMTPSKFRELLQSVGLTQVGAAKLFQVGERTVRRWASGEQDISRGVQIALCLMVKFKVTPEKAERL